MATTTNYGWTTPDDTALVKDGASAIRSLGTSVDTTTKNLNPSTTLGDIEYRSSTANTNTRVGIGSSGQALTVVAGVPSWAASATSVLTTTGDMLYASAANTLARVGVGTTGQVLTVAAGIPSWATPGGSTKSYSLLSTTTLTGATTTISSLSGYDDFFVLIRNASSSSASANLVFKINGSATATDYSQYGPQLSSPSTYAASSLTSNSYFQNNGQLYMGGMGNSASSVVNGYFTIAGANTSGKKMIAMAGGGDYATGGQVGQSMFVSGGVYNGTAVVSSITFLYDTGNLDAGTVYVYGAV